MKPESDYTLEDWVAHHTAKCSCSGHYKCSGCTIKALEESWRKTLQIERNVYIALKKRVHDDATKHNPTERS